MLDVLRGAYCTAHNPYHPRPTNSTSNPPFCTPYNPFSCSCSPPCNPLGGDSYYFHFSNSVWGAGSVQHPPLCSLYNPPSLVFCHPPTSISPFLYHPCPSTQVASQRKNIYIYLFLRGIYLLSTPPTPESLSRFLVSFSSFLLHLHLGVSRPPTPFSQSPFRNLLVSPTYRPLASSFSFFLSAFSLPPPNHPFPTTLWRERQIDAGGSGMNEEREGDG